MLEHQPCSNNANDILNKSWFSLLWCESHFAAQLINPVRHQNAWHIKDTGSRFIWNCALHQCDAGGKDSVNVCDAFGTIQIDDVFCNDNECQCSKGHHCVSTVVGCTNLFQSRNRRRCLGNETLAQRFKRCAMDQGLTTLNATNVASDWIYFKQGKKCQSIDCLAVRMFHQSDLAQCGHLLAVWKTKSSDREPSESNHNGEMTYHFVADGSRGSDLKAGTFLYSVPWSTESVVLLSKQAKSSAIDPCYTLQTRNQPNATCEGVYLQFDASVRFANSDEYVMSKLDWPVWFVVVGSVAAAIVAVGVVAVVVYRSRHVTLTPPVNPHEDDVLLCKPSDLRDCEMSNPINSVTLGPVTMRDYGKDLRQRGSVALDVTQLEAAGPS
ncbi:hypothetical protein Plhal710r2_c002g0001381 [Plasmopara halstedii]